MSYPVPQDHVVREVQHDSRGRDSQLPAFYRGHTLGNGPHDDVGGGRAVGRTITKVKKVNTMHAGYCQQPNVSATKCYTLDREGALLTAPDAQQHRARFQDDIHQCPAHRKEMEGWSIQ